MVSARDGATARRRHRGDDRRRLCRAGGRMMGIAAVQAALPQRHPLLLVDQILSVQPGQAIETIKAISATDPCYATVPAGAGQDAYAYPVSLLIESFGQSAALLWLGTEGLADDNSVLLFLGARNYQVQGEAFPGDVVRHVVRLE